MLENSKNNALINYKSSAKHLKLFNLGIELFNQGSACPIEDSPIKDGWYCGKELRDLKISHLKNSKLKYQVD